MSTIQAFQKGSADPQDARSDAAATIELVKTLMPGFEPELRLPLDVVWWSFKLPVPAKAEYEFSLSGLGEERYIGATLLQFREERSRHRFWYCPLESAGFRDDAAKLEACFHEQVRRLLQHPTRITEKKGIIWLSYRGEYQSESGWQRLRGGVMYLGLGFGVPFFGKKRVYTSPPVVSWIQG